MSEARWGVARSWGWKVGRKARCLCCKCEAFVGLRFCRCCSATFIYFAGCRLSLFAGVVLRYTHFTERPWASFVGMLTRGRYFTRCAQPAYPLWGILVQEASPTSSLNAPNTASHQLNSASSSGSSCELAHATGALPGPAAVGVGTVQGHPALAAGSSPGGPPGLPTSAPDDSWACKMPATWRYVEAVRGFQRPGEPGAATGPAEPAPVLAATLQEREELKNLPEITYHYHLDYPATEACLNLRVICGAGASHVTSCRVTACYGMSPGWRGGSSIDMLLLRAWGSQTVGFPQSTCAEVLWVHLVQRGSCDVL